MDIDAHWEDGKFVLRLGTHEVRIAREASDEQAAKSLEFLTNFFTKSQDMMLEMAQDFVRLLEGKNDA